MPVAGCPGSCAYFVALAPFPTLHCKIMIVSYLARLVLMLPDLSATETNRLAELAAMQHMQHSSAGSASYEYSEGNLASGVPDKGVEGLQLVDSPAKQLSSRKKLRKKKPTERPPEPVGFTEDGQPCVPINEALRKQLLQVRFV